MIVFRHADPSLPFLWEDASQPPARWHGDGEGPVQYFTDTPDGAWAEFLRHEEIKDPRDLATVRRAIWAVELPDEPAEHPHVPDSLEARGGIGHARFNSDPGILSVLSLEAPPGESGRQHRGLEDEGADEHSDAQEEQQPRRCGMILPDRARHEQEHPRLSQISSADPGREAPHLSP